MNRTRNRYLQSLSLLVSLLLVLAAGCAGKKTSYRVPTGEATVEVEASSFAFEPGTIYTRAGNLLLKVKNVSGMEHNLTILDPDGAKMVDVSLPAGEVTEISLSLTRAGTYSVYCGKPLHASLGMKGRIVAEGK